MSEKNVTCNFYFSSELCILFSIVVLKNILLYWLYLNSAKMFILLMLILLDLIPQKSKAEVAPIKKENNVTLVRRS